MARKNLIDSRVTSYYHVTARCVRRAFLCGYDKQTRRSYDHRKEWILERVALLTECFCIDICAYAVMDNHYHLVLHLDHERIDQWTDNEVLERKNRLYKFRPVEQSFYDGTLSSESVKKEVADDVSLWRKRLKDISWFMRSLNENIARKANKEDGCKGRFWEGRFKSQAILDEKSLQACMAYVDLNPVRVGLSASPKESRYTSIQQRVMVEGGKAIQKGCQPTLMSFYKKDNNKRHYIPFSFEDYVALVEIEGTMPRYDKPGSCLLNNRADRSNPIAVPPIIEGIESAFGWAIGTSANLRQLSKKMNKRWIKGVNAQSQHIFSHLQV